MGRGGEVRNRQYGKRRIRSQDEGSDESDEDYMVGADEEFEDSEEYCSSLAGEESEESLGEIEEEEEEEEEENTRKAGGSKRRKGFPNMKSNGVGKVHKKRRVPYKEQDDEDYEDENYDNNNDNDEKKGFLDRKKNVVGMVKAHKKRRVLHEEENNEDYEDECNNDDGDDFAPDEIDLGDEDVLEVRKKKKKLGGPPLCEKGPVKRRKRKSKYKNPTKSRGLKRKSAAGNGGAFTEKNPALRKRRDENSCPGKRIFVADSDSYFSSSASSDFEYTISEEERELVREASELCGDSTTVWTSSSSEKRLQEEGAMCQQRKRLGKKGKEKVGDLENETGNQVCGICLSEEGKKTIQGTLNCCSHFFCFVCIMEWSKVESRCPLCKQRFVTISKRTSSKTGLDLRTVVVQVPERDQVYQPSEEELRGYLDLYENMICTECQHGGDDAFMLLCDLCDSPAHTYCVDLGHDVPEGSWYCAGCRPTALGYSNLQALTPTPDQGTFNGFSGRSSSPVENGREAIDLNRMYVPEAQLTEGTGYFETASPVSGAGPSTVLERRRIQQWIQQQIRHVIDNRRSTLGGTTSGLASTSFGNYLLGSQIARAREISLQHSVAPETLASHRTFSQGRLQDNFTPPVQSRDLFPGRLNNPMGQLIWDQSSISGDPSRNGMLRAGSAGTGMDINSRLG